MPRKYPAFIYWLSHIGSPAVVCLFCYMPISAASDLVCVFFTERVTDLFNIWRNTLKLFSNDSVTLIDSTCEESHQEQEFSKQTRCLTLVLGFRRAPVSAYIFDIFLGASHLNSSGENLYFKETLLSSFQSKKINF